MKVSIQSDAYSKRNKRIIIVFAIDLISRPASASAAWKGVVRPDESFGDELLYFRIGEDLHHKSAIGI